MVSVEINGSKRLLVISAAGHVSTEEVKQAAEQVRSALQDVAPGLRALTDFRGLESMRPSAASHIAEIMDVLAEKQVTSVIRIIPTRDKEIPLNILSQFHYAREFPITTVETLVEALDRLTEQNAGLAVTTQELPSHQMRKQIVSPKRESPSTDTGWLDLQAMARVEVTSEDAAHPIQSALLAAGGTGWRAEQPGKQTARLLFQTPHKLRRIRLQFREEKETRTQEFVLRWLPATENSWHEVVRQQYHFSPSGATEEIEKYQVDLDNVAALELTIIPNVSGGSYATLTRLRLA